MLPPVKKLILSQIQSYVIKSLEKLGCFGSCCGELFAADTRMGHKDLFSLCCGKSCLQLDSAARWLISKR